MRSRGWRSWPNTRRAVTRFRCATRSNCCNPNAPPLRFWAIHFEQLNHAAPGAWPCWAPFHYDTIRHLTRWGLSDAAARYTTLLTCLRGSIMPLSGRRTGPAEARLPSKTCGIPTASSSGLVRAAMAAAWWSGDRQRAWRLQQGARRLPVTCTTAVEWPHRGQPRRDPAPLPRRPGPAPRASGAGLACDQSVMQVTGDLVQFTRSDAAETIFCAFVWVERLT